MYYCCDTVFTVLFKEELELHVTTVNGTKYYVFPLIMLPQELIIKSLLNKPGVPLPPCKKVVNQQKRQLNTLEVCNLGYGLYSMCNVAPNLQKSIM